MDTILVNNRPMSPKDWGIDAAVTALAFLFGSVQLMLAASNIIISDFGLRQYLGMVDAVPNVQVFVALAITTLPLIVRRRFPWPVFLFCLVSFLGLQNAFNGFSLTIVGPVVAIYTIATVRATAKSALDDIRSMIGVLRCGDDAAETAPTAGTDRLDDLVTYLCDAGIEATLEAKGYCRADVPAHVDMALFGIAREAVTNIVRHARARTVSIRLTVEAGKARLVVEDDGSGCGLSASAASAGALPQAADGEGHGIAGMAERVHLLGGTFAAGDRAGGGFRVVACLPTKGAEA